MASAAKSPNQPRILTSQPNFCLEKPNVHLCDLLMRGRTRPDGELGGRNGGVQLQFNPLPSSAESDLQAARSWAVRTAVGTKSRSAPLQQPDSSAHRSVTVIRRKRLQIAAVPERAPVGFGGILRPGGAFDAFARRVAVRQALSAQEEAPFLADPSP